MYLAKYILCAFVFVAALLFVIRTVSSTDLGTWRGKLSRAILSFLLLAFVGVIWYYATEENFGSKKIEIGARVISSVLYLIVLPDVWKNADKGELKEVPLSEAAVENGDAEPTLCETDNKGSEPEIIKDFSLDETLKSK